MVLDSQKNSNVEVVKSFNGGSIKIEKKWNFDLNREVEYVNVRGVKIQRRNPETDGLPGFNGTVSEFSDMTFGDTEAELLHAALMRYKIGHHTLFLGEPGFGKSRILKFLAFLLNIPFYTVSCEKNMKVRENFLFNSATDTNGNLQTRLGPLPRSMQEGALFFVDEFPNLEAVDRQTVLEPTGKPNHPTIGRDDPPRLTLNNFPGDHGATFTAQPGWFMVCAGNTAEGTGLGESNDETERESRRVRPYLLKKLPSGVRAARAAGRYVKEKKITHSSASVFQEEYFDDGEVDLTDEVIYSMTDFFEEVERTLRHEVLSQVRQTPVVHFTEMLDRAFDHFMAFQVNKGSQDKTPNEAVPIRIEELMESAQLALEFYFVNVFREDALIKAPDNKILDSLDLKNNIAAKNSLAELMSFEKNDRVPVREYIKFRIITLIQQKLFEKSGGVNVTQSIKERVTELLSPKKTQAEIDAEVAKQQAEKEAAEKAAAAAAEADAISGLDDILGGLEGVIDGAIGDVGQDAAADAATETPSELSEVNKLWLKENILFPQYDEAAATTVEFLDASKGEAVPTKPALTAALLKTLTNEQIEYFKGMRKPTLHIVPDTTAERLITGLNKPCFKTMKGAPTFKYPDGEPQQEDAYVSDFYKNALSGVATLNGVTDDQEKITGYHFVICEGDTSEDGAVPGDKDYAWNSSRNMKNSDRIAAFEMAQKPTGVQSINAAGYILAMARSLQRKEPINRKTFNLLYGGPKDEHVNDGKVTYGHWNLQVTLSSVNFGGVFRHACLCAAVMGKIA